MRGTFFAAIIGSVIRHSGTFAAGILVMNNWQATGAFLFAGMLALSVANKSRRRQWGTLG